MRIALAPSLCLSTTIVGDCVCPDMHPWGLYYSLELRTVFVAKSQTIFFTRYYTSQVIYCCCMTKALLYTINSRGATLCVSL